MPTSPKDLPRSNLTDGIKIIRLLLREGRALGVTQLAEKLAAPKSSTYRVLQTLMELGFVEQHDVTNRYALSAAIFDFVHDLAAHFGRNLNLEGHLRTVAEKLKCSVYLCMLGGNHTYVVCGAGEEGNTTRLGAHDPAFTTSAGKILVAQLDEEEWCKYAPRPESVAPTSFSNVAPERFYAQLREARQQGVAWNRRESSKNHISVAAPVCEPFVTRPRLAVALLLRYEQSYSVDFNELEREVKALALNLESKLGVPRSFASKSKHQAQ